MKIFTYHLYLALFFSISVFTKAQITEAKLSSANSVSELGITELKASTNANTVYITWKMAGGNTYNEFVIERAGENGQFSALNVVKAQNNSNDDQLYTFTDEQPVEGMNYYRLITRSNNLVKYSSVVFINFHSLLAEPVISPNPSVNGIFQLELGSKEASTIKIFNRGGKLVYETQSLPGCGLMLLSPMELTDGLYYCSIQSGNKTFQKVLVIAN
jgi:hypothetical protein